MRHAELIDREVTGGYRIVAHLGDGPSASVFAATAPDGRGVVVRVYDRARLRISEETVSRYIQSLASLASVSSPHVARVLDVGHDLSSSLLFVVREAMGGLDVRSIAAAGALDPLVAARIVAQACGGVAALHAAGVIHRALHVSNVFVELGDDVLIARACDAALVRTPADPNVDIAALGQLLVMLATGGSARGEPLTAIAPWVPRGIAEIADRATSNDPARRLPSAAAMLRLLRDELQGDLALHRSMMVPLDADGRAPPSSRRDVTLPDDDDPLLGHRLGGRFRIVRSIGRGGMGAVYEVETPSGEIQAAKIVGEGGDTRAMARFIREADVATRVRHPNVVRALELGTDLTLGAPFLVMELLRGRDLRQLYRERGAIAEVPLARVFLQLARGLAAAHALGYAHRDIKPANVFLAVAEDGAVTAKLCDFGLARALEDDSGSDLTRSGVVVGTPAYMAPEQVLDSKMANERSDVWSVCATFYEGLVGRRIWDGHDATAAETMVAVCSLPVPRVADLAPWIDARIAAIVDRGLARASAARWPDANALVRELEMVCAGDRVTLSDLTSVAMPIDAIAADSSATTRVEIAANADATTSGVRANETAPTADARRIALPPRATRSSKRPFAMGAIAIAVAAGAIVAARWRAPVAIVATNEAHAECATNADCGGAGSRVCHKRDARCVPVESNGCTLYAEPGDLARPDAIVVGVMMPMSGPDAETTWLPNVRAADLARRDFVRTAGGVPRPSGVARPFVLVACDDRTDADAAAMHLVDDLDVSAVIGFRASDELVDLATRIFVPHGVLAIATLNRSALVTSVPHPAGSSRLVWRLAASNERDALPVSLVVSEIVEPRARAERALAPSEPMRVALLRDEGASGVSLQRALYETLRFNGKSLLDNGDAFLEIVDRPDERATAVERLRAFRPHAIIAFTSDALVDGVLAPLERAWPRDARFRPRYVVPDTLEGAALYRFASTADVRHRVFGIMVPTATVANALFVTRYNEANRTTYTAASAPAFGYDAAYLVAYAAMAAGDEPITGQSLARAIARLVPAPNASRVDVGPASILEGLGALAHGGRVNLAGAAGSFDFDIATGEVSPDYAIVCLKADASGNVVDEAPSGLSLRAGDAHLRGALSCP